MPQLAENRYLSRLGDSSECRRVFISCYDRELLREKFALARNVLQNVHELKGKLSGSYPVNVWASY